MWGTDMTAAFTRDHGQVAVFVAVDHCSAECVGVHAARRGTRGSAVEDVVHHEAAGSGDAGDDLGEVGGAPGGQRTQRCRLDAHRVLPAAVLPGDAWSDKTHARACFRAFYWRIRREKREIRGARSVRMKGPIVAFMVRKALIAAHLAANAQHLAAIVSISCANLRRRNRHQST